MCQFTDPDGLHSYQTTRCCVFFLDLVFVYLYEWHTRPRINSCYPLVSVIVFVNVYCICSVLSLVRPYILFIGRKRQKSFGVLKSSTTTKKTTRDGCSSTDFKTAYTAAYAYKYCDIYILKALWKLGPMPPYGRRT